jgi:hypothetical protein
MNKPAAKQQWYIGNWTGLGWLETGIKLAAHAVAFIALFLALSRGSSFLLGLPVVLLGILTLAYGAAIVDRWLEKEIIAMVFVLINVAAHAAMTVALTRPLSTVLELGMLFAGLMLLGDAVKIAFLVRTGFTVRGIPTRVLVIMTASLVVIYALVLLILIITNQQNCCALPPA